MKEKLTFANETRTIVIAHHFGRICWQLLWTKLCVCHWRQSKQSHSQYYDRSHFSLKIFYSLRKQIEMKKNKKKKRNRLAWENCSREERKKKKKIEIIYENLPIFNIPLVWCIDDDWCFPLWCQTQTEPICWPLIEI